jgi:hypothetical protein
MSQRVLGTLAVNLPLDRAQPQRTGQNVTHS